MFHFPDRHELKTHFSNQCLKHYDDKVRSFMMISTIVKIVSKLKVVQSPKIRQSLEHVAVSPYITFGYYCEHLVAIVTKILHENYKNLHKCQFFRKNRTVRSKLVFATY